MLHTPYIGAIIIRNLKANRDKGHYSLEVKSKSAGILQGTVYPLSRAQCITTISLRGLFNIFIIALLLSYGTTLADNRGDTRADVYENRLNVKILFINCR